MKTLRPLCFKAVPSPSVACMLGAWTTPGCLCNIVVAPSGEYGEYGEKRQSSSARAFPEPQQSCPHMRKQEFPLSKAPRAHARV